MRHQVVVTVIHDITVEVDAKTPEELEKEVHKLNPTIEMDGLIESHLSVISVAATTRIG
jgi:hypothetical protein